MTLIGSILQIVINFKKIYNNHKEAKEVFK